MRLLNESEVSAALSPLKEWRREGDTIERTWSFPGFPQAIEFVDRVAEVAESAGHHPDIDIRWNKVRMALSSHDAGGLTSLDFDLAARIDALA
jgi:4a-hydroxytetrahydrobiopterin dehydratase